VNSPTSARHVVPGLVGELLVIFRCLTSKAGALASAPHGLALRQTGRVHAEELLGRSVLRMRRVHGHAAIRIQEHMRVLVGPSERLVDERIGRSGDDLPRPREPFRMLEVEVEEVHGVPWLLHEVRPHEPEAEVLLEILAEARERHALLAFLGPAEKGSTAVGTLRAGDVRTPSSVRVATHFLRLFRVPRDHRLLVALHEQDASVHELLRRPRVQPETDRDLGCAVVAFCLV